MSKTQSEAVVSKSTAKAAKGQKKPTKAEVEARQKIEYQEACEIAESLRERIKSLSENKLLEKACAANGISFVAGAYCGASPDTSFRTGKAGVSASMPTSHQQFRMYPMTLEEGRLYLALVEAGCLLNPSAFRSEEAWTPDGPRIGLLPKMQAFVVSQDERHLKTWRMYMELVAEEAKKAAEALRAMPGQVPPYLRDEALATASKPLA